MPRKSKKVLRARDYKSCVLEPVEPDIPNPIPGVPEHFNYGIFYDDGADYMSHLKSRNEFDGAVTYKILGLKNAEPVNLVSHTERQPELVIEDETTNELNMDSDAEDVEDNNTSTSPELEDNFVQLAGGEALKPNNSNNKTKQCPGPSQLSMQKALMMERFLFGDNQSTEHAMIEEISDDDYGSEEDSSAKSEADDQLVELAEGRGISRTGRQMTTSEIYMENEFKQLMRKCKRSNGVSGAQSCASGASMYSESLRSALEADSVQLDKKKTRQEILAAVLQTDKSIVMDHLKRLEEMEAEYEKEDPIAAWIGPQKKKNDDIVSIATSNASRSALRQPKLLTVPKTKMQARRKQLSIGSENSATTQSDGDDSNSEKSSNTVMIKDIQQFVRTKGESKEEKKARKQAVSKYKKARRQVRMANKDAFKGMHVSVGAGIRVRPLD